MAHLTWKRPGVRAGARGPDIGTLRRRGGKEPDYRFTLANERTFLAYVRTALALDAAGLAAEQFLSPTANHLRLALAIGLTVLGGLVVVQGYARWDSSECAMRHELPLPAVRLPLLLAVGMTAVSLGAVALIVVSR